MERVTVTKLIYFFPVLLRRHITSFKRCFNVIITLRRYNDVILTLKLRLVSGYYLNQNSLHNIFLLLHRTVRVSATDAALADPVLFIQTSVIPNLEQKAKDKDVNQVSSLVVSASNILADGQGSSKSKKETLNQLVDGISSMDATSVVNIAQLLNAFNSIQRASGDDATGMEGRSRKTIHDSLRRLMSLSNSFAAQLISLDTSSQDAFMELITGIL